MHDEIPRRNRVDQWTLAEHAIAAALAEVERVGADVRLTDAVVLLNKARHRVADYVDRIRPEPLADSDGTMVAAQALAEEVALLSAAIRKHRDAREQLRARLVAIDETPRALYPVTVKEYAYAFGLHPGSVYRSIQRRTFGPFAFERVGRSVRIFVPDDLWASISKTSAPKT